MTPAMQHQFTVTRTDIVRLVIQTGAFRHQGTRADNPAAVVERPRLSDAGRPFLDSFTNSAHPIPSELYND